MLQTMKWSFAFVMAFASMAQAQSHEPKPHDEVREGVFAIPGQNLNWYIDARIQSPM